MDSFVKDGSITKSGTTITYGPYYNMDAGLVAKYEQPISVHYNFDHPVLEVKTLRRTAEISHWGTNLNIEDNVDLHNAGPT